MKEKSCYYVFIKVQLLVGFILMPCEEELGSLRQHSTAITIKSLCESCVGLAITSS